jgi:molybdate transport system permease protein
MDKMSFKKVSIGFAFFIFFLYSGLILSLFYFFEWGIFIKTVVSSRTLFAIKLSLTAATIATMLSVFLAVPAAYALSRFEFPGRQFIDTLIELPMVVSPAALGAMLLIFFNTPAGGAVQDHGIQFVFTFYGIILAQLISTLGIAVRLVKAALDEIPSRYESVARILGASSWKAFYTVTLPLARQGIVAAFVLTWAKAVGEFGATIMIAGTMAMRTETLPIAIFLRIGSADIEGAVALIFILLSIGISVLYGVRMMTGKKYA